MPEPAPNPILSQALQAVIKKYVETDQVLSGNHCLRCSLARAHADLQAVQATVATVMGFTPHSHRGGKAEGKETP